MSTNPIASAPTCLSEAEFQQAWERRHHLLHWAGVTYRYHRKRQWFYGLLDKLTQAVAVGGGVAVAGQTLPDALPLVGGLIAFAGMLALVFGYGDKRQCHKELAERTMQLSGSILGHPTHHLGEEQVCEWERMRAAIDLSEPTSLKALVHKCEYEQAVAEGHPSHVPPIPWWRQAYMHFG